MSAPACNRAEIPLLMPSTIAMVIWYPRFSHLAFSSPERASCVNRDESHSPMPESADFALSHPAAINSPTGANQSKRGLIFSRTGARSSPIARPTPATNELIRSQYFHAAPTAATAAAIASQTGALMDPITEMTPAIAPLIAVRPVTDARPRRPAASLVNSPTFCPSIFPRADCNATDAETAPQTAPPARPTVFIPNARAVSAPLLPSSPANVSAATAPRRATTAATAAMIPATSSGFAEIHSPIRSRIGSILSIRSVRIGRRALPTVIRTRSRAFRNS